MDLLSSHGSYNVLLPHSSLPTPPCSPQRSLRPSRPMDSTINLLESLISFYHQERMWVYRTRASLEFVLESVPFEGRDHSLRSSMGSESDSLDENVSTDTSSLPSRDTLWMRRKKSFKLKLEGISIRGRRRHTFSGHEAPTSGIQMLELFENMMQARMESCERVTKLVRDASTWRDDS